jgi:hypothetical protein
MFAIAKKSAIKSHKFNDLHLTEIGPGGINTAKSRQSRTALTDESHDHESSPRQEQMLRLHGEVCDINEAARILKYPSAQALQKAMRRAKAPVRLVKMPNRRGLFASTRALARYLDALFMEDELPSKPAGRVRR